MFWSVSPQWRLLRWFLHASRPPPEKDSQWKDNLIKSTTIMQIPINFVKDKETWIYKIKDDHFHYLWLWQQWNGAYSSYLYKRPAANSISSIGSGWTFLTLGHIGWRGTARRWNLQGMTVVMLAMLLVMTMLVTLLTTIIMRFHSYGAFWVFPRPKVITIESPFNIPTSGLIMTKLPS